MRRYKGLTIVLLVAMVATMLPGCAAPTPEVIKETVEVPVEVEVTRVVEKEVEVPAVAAEETVYEVVWPLGKPGLEMIPLASRPDTLDGKTICEYWCISGFQGDKTFAKIDELLKEQFADVKIVPWIEFSRESKGKAIGEIVAVAKEHKCDAFIGGNGG